MILRDITLTQVLHDTTQKFPDCHAIEYEGRFYTWSEIDALSDAFANYFEHCGIRKGDHIGVWGANSLNWVLSFFALNKIGATAVLINSNITIHELRDVIAISKITWMLCGYCPHINGGRDLINYIKRTCPQLQDNLIDIESEADPQSILKDYGSPRTDAGVAADDICCMIFTSGSTRKPKCAMLTHYSMANNAESMAEAMNITDKDAFCMSLPLFHMYGLVGCFLACVHRGTTVHLIKALHSVDIMECIHKHRCTVLNGVPTSYLALINNESFSKYDLTSIRLSVFGGAPLTPAHLRRIQDAFPQTQFMSNFGQTESTCLTNTMYDDSFDMVATTVGPPLEHIEMAIMDTETRELLPPNTQGEIVVRGYCTMRRYFNPDPEVDTPFDEDGWLHTQDLGMLLDNGYLRIVGRIKDIIIRAGEDITPSELERVIMEYDQISDARVLGAPHDILGEHVIACIVLKQPNTYKESELRDLFRRKLAKFKHPSEILVFDEFPTTASGKISPRRLREEMLARLAELLPVCVAGEQ